MEVYQEEELSSFTHDGARYDLNKVLRFVHDIPVVDQPIGAFTWVLRHCKPDPARVAKADISKAILIAWSDKHRKFAPVDGLHRLQRAVNERKRAIPAVIVPQYILEQCRLTN